MAYFCVSLELATVFALADCQFQIVGCFMGSVLIELKGEKR